jgi:hypothetical protein
VELLAKSAAATRIKGVVGRTGINIPATPSPTKKTPRAIYSIFRGPLENFSFLFISFKVLLYIITV